MDVATWLRDIGLGQYEAAFRDNEIDDNVLHGLTTDDLKDLGVTIVGHRRKLLDSIALLRSNGDGKTAAAKPFPTIDGSTRDLAERRQVTVMFSDLVGSTALSARIDPEDLREVVSCYRRSVAEAVRRYGGFVAQNLGDGVLVYFGYPQAHEDDAERAVRAGLDVIAAVRSLQTLVPLQTRIGIATGLVVVGDLIGSDLGREHAIVGETPNLAARLQSVAGPDEVVIAESTRRLLGDLFELDDLGIRELKGVATPIRAFIALRAAAVESRFEALRAKALTELVGRAEERELLQRRWLKAKTAEGQVVLLCGEPGIGKSRLTAEFLQDLAAEPHIRLRYFCSQQHTDSALYPIVRQFERTAGFAEPDTMPVRLDKLDALLAVTSTGARDAALFAEMLSLTNDGRYPALHLEPQLRRQRTLEALVAQIEAMATNKPVLLIFEDAHWSDPTSLEALGRAIERIAALRVLLIVTFRPEFDAPWVGRPHVSTLTINRLTLREVGAMIDHLTGNALLPASFRQDIIERTDGIPLFVEEMTKAILEAESPGAAETTVTAAPPATTSVPASLHASLMARLDRLGTAKELAQIGAAIGREFSYALLTAVARKPTAEIETALDRLIAAGLLFEQGSPPHASYLFKHALVQDAAYGTLLREPRRALHGRIAETLEGEFAEAAERQPELLARHYTEAGQIEKAASLWGQAGLRSLERSALAEAAGQLNRALVQIAKLPETPARRREQIKLQVALVHALMHVKGYGAPEPRAAVEQARLFIERAQALGESPDDPFQLFTVLYGVWVASYVAFNGDVTRDLAAQFLALAQQQGAAVPLMIGHRIMGVALTCCGELSESRAHHDRALALYDPAKHRQLAALFGQDPGVSILSYRSLSLWVLGYPDSALADSAQALSDAREIGQGATLMFALGLTSFCHVHCGDYATASARIEELIALAGEKGALFWKVGGLLLRGCVLAVSGKPQDAAQMIASGLAGLRSTGATVFAPLWLSYLARAHIEVKKFDEAQRSIDEAMTVVEATGQRWCEADIHRLAGEIARQQQTPDAARAEACFARALVIARAQQAKSWELRAAMSMAQLWHGQGRGQDARDLLAPIYRSFTEGRTTFDLVAARSLLDQLSCKDAP